MAPKKLREIERIFDAPPLPEALIRFVDWVADYTLAPRGMVLRMVLRSPEALEPEKPMVGVRLAGPPPERLTAARKRVLDAAADGLAWSKSGLAAAAGVSTGVVDGLLAQRHAGDWWRCRRGRSPPTSTPTTRGRSFRLHRKSGGGATWCSGRGDFSVALLDGVTGSGKTEVYFEAVAETLRRGKQALILLPEIALTGAFLDRFAARFGSRPAEWHSEVGTRSSARASGARSRAARCGRSSARARRCSCRFPISA